MGARSYRIHLRRLPFLDCSSAMSASLNIVCMVLCGICIPVVRSIVRSRETAPLHSPETAESTAECSRRPGRLFLGLPRFPGYDIAPNGMPAYRRQSFWTHRAEMPAFLAIAPVGVPLRLSRMIHLTFDSSSFFIIRTLRLPI